MSWESVKNFAHKDQNNSFFLCVNCLSVFVSDHRFYSCDTTLSPAVNYKVNDSWNGPIGVRKWVWIANGNQL